MKSRRKPGQQKSRKQLAIGSRHASNIQKLAAYIADHGYRHEAAYGFVDPENGQKIPVTTIDKYLKSKALRVALEILRSETIKTLENTLMRYLEGEPIVNREGEIVGYTCNTKALEIALQANYPEKYDPKIRAMMYAEILKEKAALAEETREKNVIEVNFIEPTVKEIPDPGDIEVE